MLMSSLTKALAPCKPLIGSALVIIICYRLVLRYLFEVYQVELVILENASVTHVIPTRSSLGFSNVSEGQNCFAADLFLPALVQFNKVIVPHLITNVPNIDKPLVVNVQFKRKCAGANRRHERLVHVTISA